MQDEVASRVFSAISKKILIPAGAGVTQKDKQRISYINKRSAKASEAHNRELQNVEQRKSDVALDGRLFYEMLENMPVMVCLITPDYKIPYGNRLFREKFGESEDRHCYDYCSGKDKPCEFCESLVPLKTGKPHHWIGNFNGQYIEAYDFAFTDINGNPMVLEVDIDITERINLETELKEKERLATIGETAAMVGHDIRNPLQAILGDLYLIASEVTLLPDGKEKENIKESLSALRNNVEYINKIIQDLQDYAKIQHPNFQDVDFERVVQNLLVNNDFPENIDVAYTLDEDARRFIADPDFLRRILNNLVSNAVHAMPEGGKLDIQARKEN